MRLDFTLLVLAAVIVTMSCRPALAEHRALLAKQGTRDALQTSLTVVCGHPSIFRSTHIPDLPGAQSAYEAARLLELRRLDHLLDIEGERAMCRRLEAR
jgi:hypothetical protein